MADDMTVADAAKAWQTERSQVMRWIYAGRVPGAEVRVGPDGRRRWAIPEGTPRPLDGRNKGVRVLR